MNKKIDWLNHTLEFLVVLVGILIAFQLNKCSDRESKTALIKDHMQYIQSECEENKSTLDSAIIHIKTNSKS